MCFGLIRYIKNMGGGEYRTVQIFLRPFNAKELYFIGIFLTNFSKVTIHRNYALLKEYGLTWIFGLHRIKIERQKV
jgi:hypothetical protein